MFTIVPASGVYQRPSFPIWTSPLTVLFSCPQEGISFDLRRAFNHPILFFSSHFLCPSWAGTELPANLFYLILSGWGNSKSLNLYTVSRKLKKRITYAYFIRKKCYLTCRENSLSFRTKSLLFVYRGVICSVFFPVGSVYGRHMLQARCLEPRGGGFRASSRWF